VETAKVEPEPVSSINLEEWRQYQAATAPPISRIVLEDPTMGLLEARQRKERETLASRLRQQFLPPLLGTPSNSIHTCPRSVLNLARHLLKLQQRKEIQRLRRKIKRPRLGKQRFEDWLRGRSLGYQADQWRYRHTLEHMPQNMREAPPLPEGQKYDPLKAYAAHRHSMLKSDPDMEPSRMDALIALQMRNKGFTREAVQKAIFQCAQEGHPTQPERDWQRYAERATAYAFGIAGDITLAHAATERENKERHVEEAEQTPRMRMR
jgi:hypothetical protein